MKTIQKDLYLLNKVKNSNFYVYAYKINSIEQVNNLIKIISDNHCNANHICYSYRLIQNNVMKEYYFESTEPHGSSGMQIYNNLINEDIVNTLIIVVREFSGSKLGLGLLSRSYNSSAKLVLKNNLIPYELEELFKITINNKTLEYFKKISMEYNIKIFELIFCNSNIILSVFTSENTINILKEKITFLEIKKLDTI